VVELHSVEDRRVLVTGATGFIGSWLSERLTKQGNRVAALVRPNSRRRWCIRHLEGDLDVIYGDIRDSNLVAGIVDGKDVIFHLAAITQVINSVRDPVETFSVNLQGTINLLEAVRRSDQGQVLILASTDKVYGEPIRLPITEEDPLLGKSPYDASKIAAERAAYAYFRTYGIPVLISRSSNVYGGRDLNFLRAVPDFVSSAVLGEKIVARGSGRHVRDFVFVDDAVAALLKMAANAASHVGEAFNFGTGKPTSVSELAMLVSRYAGVGFEVLDRDTPGEIDVQFLDSRKAKEKLGWEAKTELADGLHRTLEWYSANKPLWISERAFVRQEVG